MNLLIALLGIALVPSSLPVDGLTCQPPNLIFTDSYSGAQLLVSRKGADATGAAAYSSSDTKIVRVDARGYVTPAGNGKATIRIANGDFKCEVPVIVRGFGNGRAIDFQTEVVPLLSKLGCNSGGCHGKQSGQNGFKLSLFGFDAEFDYDALAREARGRRISPSDPDDSLFLRKAAGRMPHGGGKKLDPASADYRVLREWIAAGAPATAKDAAQVKAIKILPGDRVLNRGATQQLAVLAEYTDGTKRDVTRQAEFFSNLDTVASVDSFGGVKAEQQSGEAAIMARHRGYVAVFLALVPHAEPLAELPDIKPVNFVDELAASKLKKLGLRPSPHAGDATFLRRVTLDLCGHLPTVEETEAFLADTSADKRAKRIDALLDSNDYSAYFAMKWGSILRNSNLAGADRAATAFHLWIKDQLARNRPYDEFVRGIVAAAGEWADAPAINWFWQNRDDFLHQTTADTAQLFLGVRLQCAKCHHHPYERWGQADYYGLAGFFTRVGRKSFGEPPPHFTSSAVTSGEKNPLTGKTPEPKYLDGGLAKFTAEDDPRHALVDWMAKPENPFFAKAFVNRMWGHFFGRGLFHEVDDLRETNPASNPELLDALAKDFLAHKFDMKHVIRTILNSRVYQLSSEPTDFNKDDRQNFARYYARRLPAEVLHDAVMTVTGNKVTFNGAGDQARAIDLPHENFTSYFLDTFDRPKRVTVCDCERSSAATLGQVLLLANSDEVESKIENGESRIAKRLAAKKTRTEIVREIYLAAFSRRPTPAESERIEKHLDREPNQKAGLEDVMWTVLNSKEFLFNK